MVILSQSLPAACAEISRFEGEVQRCQQLRNRLAYSRAWYACADENGKWLFGPSKFIGYQGLSGDRYVKLSKERRIDGRKTEVQLKNWFMEVDPSSDRYEQLSSALSAFLAKYGKTPSQKMRINVPKTLDGAGQDGEKSPIVDLIIAVANSLKPSQRETLLRRLGAVQR